LTDCIAKEFLHDLRVFPVGIEECSVPDAIRVDIPRVPMVSLQFNKYM
jgi:hypothetical protein